MHAPRYPSPRRAAGELGATDADWRPGRLPRNTRLRTPAGVSGGRGGGHYGSTNGAWPRCVSARWGERSPADGRSAPVPPMLPDDGGRLDRPFVQDRRRGDSRRESGTVGRGLAAELADRSAFLRDLAARGICDRPRWPRRSGPYRPWSVAAARSMRPGAVKRQLGSVLVRGTASRYSNGWAWAAGRSVLAGYRSPRARSSR